MLRIVEGPPGSGKSYTTVDLIERALSSGRLVATNVAFVDGWEREMARAKLSRRFRRRRVAQLVEQYRANFFVSDSLEDLMRVRLRGEKEGRGLLVLDEGHNWMNARTWSAADRSAVVKFFSQHRKLGWDIVLISQRAENVDAQVRGNAEYIVTMRNLRRVKLAGFPVFPFNVFLAFWTWESNGEFVQRDWYRLNRRLARLYDSLALSHGLQDEPNPIWLPRSAEALEAPPAPLSVTDAVDCQEVGPDDAHATTVNGAGPEPEPLATHTDARTDGQPDASRPDGRPRARP